MHPRDLCSSLSIIALLSCDGSTKKLLHHEDSWEFFLEGKYINKVNDLTQFSIASIATRQRLYLQWNCKRCCSNPLGHESWLTCPGTLGRHIHFHSCYKIGPVTLKLHRDIYLEQ